MLKHSKVEPNRYFGQITDRFEIFKFNKFQSGLFAHIHSNLKRSAPFKDFDSTSTTIIDKRDRSIGILTKLLLVVDVTHVNF